jgi:hypothetical protein
MNGLKKNMTELEKAIQNRLETGFKNWNGGYQSWLNWCNTLYDDKSMYNVYGERWTMQQYKDAMGKFFNAFDIELGKFHNMLIEGNWAAIRYDVHCVNKETGKRMTQQSMEFVRFKEIDRGVVVDEGWACSTTPLHGKD